MKLLIVTQAVDLDDPILGFFHAWVAALAEHFESVEVICLRQGKHALPANVRVHSLGKERGGLRLLYATRFGFLIWQLRTCYDRVFVHMNPEYLILGGMDWHLMGKKVAFWYNHPQDDWRLRLAAFFADQIFYTSPYAATAQMRGARRMPAGIDTELFKPHNVPRNRHALYMQGRIMPSKRIEVALAALRIVREKLPATLTVVGPEEPTYGAKLRKDFADLISTGAVTFEEPKPNSQTPALYSAHGLSLNAAAAGHFDKSVLESMACATPVVLSSIAFAGLVPPEWVVEEGNAHAFAEAILRILALPEKEYAELGQAERVAVVASESLGSLIAALAKKLSP